MKRYLWLLLLISVGLNLGLGWRLFSQSRQAAEPARTERAWRGGSGRDGEREPGREREGREATRPAFADTAAWRQLMEHRMERMADRLEMTDEQRATFRANQSELFPVFGQLRRRVGETQRRLFDLVGAEVLDREQIRAAAADVSDCRASLDSLVTETLLHELDALEPHQRQRFLEMLPWDRVGMRPGPPDGPDGRPSGGRGKGRRHE